MATPRPAKKSRSPTLQLPSSAGPGRSRAITPNTTRVAIAKPIDTARPRRGRKGAKADSSLSSWPSGPGSVIASQPAGGDVGHEDRPGTQVIQLVHDRVGPRARNHGADGRP